MKRLKEIFGEQWFEFLKEFLVSQEFRNIGMTLKKYQEAGFKLTPNFADMFRAFKECPLDKMHSIVLGMD